MTDRRIVHQLTPQMRIAVLAIVQDGKTHAEAAELASLSIDVMRKELREDLAVRTFYDAQMKLLIDRAKAKALHVLVKEGVRVPQLRLAWRRPE